jgi:hypothetical protein
MTTEELINEGIVKEEAIGYLKSAFNLQQGKLIMTNKRLYLTAHKTTVGGGGILGAFLKSKVEAVNEVFNLEYTVIGSIVRGKHGLQTNVLDITDKQNNNYRIIVKNFQEWEDALKNKLKTT